MTDDVAIIVREDNLMILKTRLVSAILQIGDNLSLLGLVLEHGKTNLISFDYGKSKTESITFNLEDIIIRSSESAKFLGITFDYKMNFEKQINNVIEKANKVIEILKYLNRISWGIEVNTVLLIYKSYISYIRSILEYVFLYIIQSTLEAV